MKQHLEVKDLEQLTELGKEKLQEWWKPQYGDMYCVNDAFGGEFLVIGYEKHDSGYEKIQNEICDYYGCPEFNDKEKTLPLLSLGQMIEFLGDDWYRETGSFTVTGYDSVYPDDYEGNETLCDSLWSACVEILNKE